MTLDEAINFYERQTEELYKAMPCDGCAFEVCKSHHRQLTEWFKELKAYREVRTEITRKMNSGQWSEGVVYGLDKAVRIMEKHLREVNTNADSGVKE